MEGTGGVMLEELVRLPSSYVPLRVKIGGLTEDKETDHSDQGTLELVSYAIEGYPWMFVLNISSPSHSSDRVMRKESGSP